MAVINVTKIEKGRAMYCARAGVWIFPPDHWAFGQSRETAWGMSGFLSGSYGAVDRLLERVKMVH